MSEETRQKIIEAGAAIIHAKGFNHTGIQEILNAAKVPKGSFYFYFKSKDDFGLQVIDYFASMMTDLVGEYFNDPTLLPLQKFQRFFDRLFELFHSQACTCGCPMGNLAQEMSDLNPDFRKRIDHAYCRQIDQYVQVLKEAQEQGEVSANLDIKETARFMVRSLAGALMHMKVTKTLEPLENWQKIVFEQVLTA